MVFFLWYQWTQAGSLRYLSHSRSNVTRRQPLLNVDIDVSTSEPVLCRRRPILISSQSHRRRRRWLKDDEVEIPLDETNTLPIDDISTVLSDVIPSDNATLDIKHTVIAADEEILLSTDTNLEQSTEKQVVLTTLDSTIDANVTEGERLVTNQSNDNQTISDDLTTIESTSKFESTNILCQFLLFVDDNQTEISVMDEASMMNVSMPNTAITLLDYTATFPAAVDANETSTDSPTEIIQEDTTIINNESVNSTTISNETIDNIPQNSTEVTDQGTADTTMVSDIIQNDASTIVDGGDEYSNETTPFVSTTTVKPVCDQSCQCLRKCHYGFEIINGTCQCDEPCKVSFNYNTL